MKRHPSRRIDRESEWVHVAPTKLSLVFGRRFGVVGQRMEHAPDLVAYVGRKNRRLPLKSRLNQSSNGRPCPRPTWILIAFSPSPLRDLSSMSDSLGEKR